MDGNGNDPKKLLEETNEILRGMWADNKATNATLNAKIDRLTEEVAKTNARLDQTNAELAHTRNDLSGEIRMLRAATSEGFSVLAGSDRTQRGEVDELRGRVSRIEEHLGLRPEP